MDFSKLGQNEKLAVYGSAAVIIGLLVASAGFFGFGFGTLAILAAIAMLIVIFLPQLSAGTSLPGSKGSLMLICGGIAAAFLVLTLLSVISFFGALLTTLNGILFLVALLGSLLMAWAGWQEFQSEGGKFQIGTPAGGAASASRPSSGSDVRESAPPAATAPSSPPPAAAPPPQTTPDQASAAQAPAAASEAPPARTASAPPADLSPQGDTTPRNDLSPREGSEHRDPGDRPLG